MHATRRHVLCAWVVPAMLACSCVDWEKAPAPAPLAVTSATTSSQYARHVNAKSDWQVHSNLRKPQLAIDGKADTCAESASADSSRCWVLLDFRERLTFQAVELLHGQATAHPRRYRIEVSETGWPYVRVFEGLATDGRTIAIFERPQRSRFMKISSLEGSGRSWKLAEINLY